MYKNIGKKIKVLSMILGWIFLIAGVAGCIYINVQLGRYDAGRAFVVSLIPLISGFVLYVLTWTMCAFGQMSDDIQNIRKLLSSGETPKKPTLAQKQYQAQQPAYEAPRPAPQAVPYSVPHSAPQPSVQPVSMETQVLSQQDGLAEDGSWVCANCGSTVYGGAKFCNHCGNPHA